MKFTKSVTDYRRKLKAFNEGVIHVTLDPEGPGSVRLHLTPPKPSFWKDPPSLLTIDGYYAVPVGPSWSMVLRTFFNELQENFSDSREITEEEFGEICFSVAEKVRHFYRVEKDEVIADLNEIIRVAIGIANGEIPEEIGQGDAYDEYQKYANGPQRMDLIVSSMIEGGQRRCQLNCSCCYAENSEMMVVDKELSTKNWKRIIDKCKKAGVPMLTFTGGEPLYRKDIINLVEYSKWFVTRINTNGYGLTVNLAKRLFRASLDNIQITLYSSNPKIHDRLVGRVGAWNKTVEGIKNALSAGLSTSVNTPLLNLNQDYPEMIKMLSSLGVRYFTCSGLIPAGKAIGEISNGNNLTAESLELILKKAVETCRELGVNIGFTSPGQLDEDVLKKIGINLYPTCGACLYNMAISPQGEVIPCQSWLNGQTFGNMLHDDWKKIWKNNQRKMSAKKNAGKNHCPLRKE